MFTPKLNVITPLRADPKEFIPQKRSFIWPALFGVLIFIIAVWIGFFAEITILHFVFLGAFLGGYWFIRNWNFSPKTDVYKSIKTVIKEEHLKLKNNLDDTPENIWTTEYPFHSGLYHVYFIKEKLLFTLFNNIIKKRDSMTPDKIKKEIENRAVLSGLIADAANRERIKEDLREHGYSF